MKPNNFIFAMADQLRWDAQSYADPSSAVRTPALDRIASEGVRVRFSWSSTPTCTPARAALLTGRRPWGHGMLGYGAVAEHYPLVFPRVLRDAGYTTVSLGKDHFGWNATSDSGISHGYQQTSLYDGLGSWNPRKLPHPWDGEYDDYDRWFATQVPGKDPSATLDGLDGNGWNGWHGRPFVYEERLHPTAWLGAQAVAFLRAHNVSADPPFLLKVSFHRPHSPYDPPQRLLDTIRTADLHPMARCTPSSSPSSSSPSASSTSCWSERFRGNASAGDPPGCEVKPDAWCGAMPDTPGILGRRAYLASVAFVDEQIGYIYDALVATHLLETTFVLWTSDHGDGQGDHYHWRKGYPYEFSAHVPLLLRWPNAYAQRHTVAVSRGAVLEPPIVTELRDVFHTIVDAAGLSATVAKLKPAFDATDGKSMLCLLTDPMGAKCGYKPNPGPWRTYVDLEHSTCYNMTNHWSALTDGRLKYVYRAWKGDEQLFNLTGDPKEVVDLAVLPSHASIVTMWRQRMVQQFEAEGRGDKWVQDGKLMVRPQGETYGPNYPKGPDAKAGDRIVMRHNGGGVTCHTNDCWRLEKQPAPDHGGGDADDNSGNTLLRLLGVAGSVKGGLCLTAPSSLAPSDMYLIVDACTASMGAQQRFSTTNHTTPSSSSTDHAVTVIHTPSGMCVTSPPSSCADCPTALQPCAAAGSPLADRQLFLFGASGRLCATAYDSLCLHADAKWPAWWEVPQP